jgi:hypothetical protein
LRLNIDLTKDLILKDKHKAEEKKLEKELKKGPVTAEILWIKKLSRFEGVSVNFKIFYFIF